MKLAIIGSGVAALEAAWHFYKLGAYVTAFSREKMGGVLYAMALHFPHQPMPWCWSELTSDLASELELNVDLRQRPTYQEYYQLYLDPAFEYMKLKISVRHGEVQRVHKSTYNLGELPDSGTRLKDTFRIVWKQNPAEMVAAMVSENQELFKMMGQDLLNSLEVPIESYEDFDLVIDATGSYSQALAMGPGGTQALNESNLEIRKNIHYGIDAFKQIPELKDGQKVALIGSGQSALSFLILARTWIEKNSLQVITTESRAFLQALENAPVPIREEALSFLISLDEEYQRQCENFSSLMHAWRDLDEPVRQKTPMPKEPQRKVEFFENSNVISLDRLVDREGLFLTHESSPLRTQAKAAELKTLALDKVFVLTGFEKKLDQLKLMHAFDHNRKNTLSVDGDHPEVGFFTLGATQRHKTSSYAHEDILQQLVQVEEHILKYFSRAPESV